MNSRVDAIVEKFLATTDGGVSVLLFGSALEEGWTGESDIDLFLIADNLETDVSHVVLDDVVLEIQKDNFTQLLQDLEAEKGNIRNRNLATMLATAKILKSDNASKLQVLKQEAQAVLNSPAKYTNEDEKAWRESIDDYLFKCQRDLQRDDAVAFQLDSTYVVQNLLDLFLAKHNSYLPQPKHLKARLLSLDPAFTGLFEKFCKAVSLSDKLECLSGLYAIVK